MVIGRLTLIILILGAGSSYGLTPIQQLMSSDAAVRKEAAKELVKSGNRNYIPSIIEVAFYYTIKKDRAGVDEIISLLRKITNENPGTRYFDWVRWIGKHSEIQPLPEYVALKREILSIIDRALASFLKDEKSLRIRPEEIVWGGVKKDGIPALINPPNISAEEATYLKDSDRVFGVFLNNESRAYPLRIMDWHEMVNDVVGGRAFTIPYCTLCGSAILYDTQIDGRTFTFGSSGLLYRSNKLMYDHNTESLWSALSGEPVAGKLAGGSLKLQILPIILTTWGEWRRRHSDTTVLSLQTGYNRDYNVEPYREYFASDKLMFPVPVEDDRLALKEFIFALRLGKTLKAYPLDLLVRKGRIQDRVGDMNVVLIADASNRSARAYKCTSGTPNESWQTSEESLTAPDGSQKCSRLPGHLAYWFGWYAQFPDTELFTEP